MNLWAPAWYCSCRLMTLPLILHPCACACVRKREIFHLRVRQLMPHAYTYICTYIHIHTNESECIHICMYANMYENIYNMYIYTNGIVCVCNTACIHTCLYIHASIHLYRHICIYTRVCMCDACACIYIVDTWYTHTCAHACTITQTLSLYFSLKHTHTQ